MTEKYKDPAWLNRKWNEERLDQAEMAEMCGVSQATISKYINELNITRPWRDHDRLRKLYEDDKKTLEEIAALMNCSPDTVYNELVKAGATIRRGGSHLHAAYRTDHQGYEYWYTRSGGRIRYLAVHRLLAVAIHGTDAVAENVVHHDNDIPWDNRPENLQLMDHDEHSSHHINEQIERGNAPWE